MNRSFKRRLGFFFCVCVFVCWEEGLGKVIVWGEREGFGEIRVIIEGVGSVEMLFSFF